MGVGAKNENTKDVFVPTTSCVLVLTLAMDFVNNGSKMQVVLSISMLDSVKVVTWTEYPGHTVGGDRMLLIEKLSCDPAAAVLFKELVKIICCPKSMQDRVEVRRVLLDLLVQPWVRVEIMGVKEELAELGQLGGNVTEMEPFLLT